MRNNQQKLRDAIENKSHPLQAKIECAQCGIPTRNADMMPEYGVCVTCYAEGGWYVDKVENEMQLV